MVGPEHVLLCIIRETHFHMDRLPSYITFDFYEYEVVLVCTSTVTHRISFREETKTGGGDE